MYPGGQRFVAYSQPGYPVMHGTNMAVPQPGMGMQTHQMMPAPYVGPGQAQVNQMGFVPQDGVPMQRFVSPPSYTPQMADDFKIKRGNLQQQQQQLLDQQQKNMEKAIKQQKFQETQKRLQQLGSKGSMGTRKMDADSLIQSIMGESKTKASEPVSHQAVTNTVEESPTDDSFGDFMCGPAVQYSVNTSNASTLQEPVVQPAEPVVSPQIEQREQPPVEVRDNKKDLMSMMLECSDLSAPQKAKVFVKKKSVKDVTPVKVKPMTFNQSKKSRTWRDDANMTEMFTLPAEFLQPQPQKVVHSGSEHSEGKLPNTSESESCGGEAFILPKWCFGGPNTPPVYLQVLEACTRDGHIVTELLYPILLRSSLSREVLGHIWTLSNKQTPGQLVQEELFLLLAMVAVAQNNMNIKSLDILAKCLQAPIPNLGQNQTPVSEASTESAVSSPAAPLVSLSQTTESSASSNTMVAPGMMTAGLVGNTSVSDTVLGKSQSTPVFTDQADEFADFQSASSIEPAEPFGSFVSNSLSSKATSINASTDYSNSISRSAPVVAPTVKTDNQLSAHDKHSSDTSYVEMNPVYDEFADFQSVEATSAIKSRSKPDVLNNEFEPAESGKEFKSVKTTGRHDNFTDFTAFQSDQSKLPSDKDIKTFFSPALPAESAKHIPSLPHISDKNLDSAFDDFGDFSSSVKNVTGASDVAENDKYAALKNIISNSALYQSKPATDENQSVSQSDKVISDNSEWTVFDDHPVVVTPCDNSPSVTSDNTSSNMFHFEASTKSDSDFVSAESPWSDFKIAHSDVADSRKIDWSSSVAVNNSHSDDISDNKAGSFAEAEKKPKAKNDAKSTLSKGRNIFGRNFDPVVKGIGTGVSPLDILPPEIPDVKDDDEDDFDEFGTFQGSHGNGTLDGISSLALGFSNVDDMAVNLTPTDKQTFPKSSSRDTFDTQSNSSSEFSGWKGQSKANKEETQSTNSLEFRPLPGSKENSPVGGDSQSVSSLEFPADPAIRKSGSDQRSIASLELKPPTVDLSSPEDNELKPPTDDQSPEETELKMEEAKTASEISPVNETVQNVSKVSVQQPRDASELLQDGSIQTLGDRYSDLVKTPRDSDRHINDWQRCLRIAHGILQQANQLLNAMDDITLCQEVLTSQQGADYAKSIIEVYLVARRIAAAKKGASVGNVKLGEMIKTIDREWQTYVLLTSGQCLLPKASSLDFSECVVRADQDDAQNKACGVCLLNVDATTPSSLQNATPNTGSKLTYGGRQYHTPCANFWINCVDLMLPALKIPELL